VELDRSGIRRYQWKAVCASSARPFTGRFNPFLQLERAAPLHRTAALRLESSAREQHDGAIMMSRTHIGLDSEMQRRARERAAHLGVSLAEYIRRLVARDLGEREPRVDPSAVFDLGSSTRSVVAHERDAMVGEAVAAEWSRAFEVIR
jgi:hypothetical protein